jgi:glutamate racemase
MNSLNENPIVLLGGTPKDTDLGCELGRAKGITCIPKPMAATPMEQYLLQRDSPGTLQKMVEHVIAEAAVRNVGHVIIFCNSMATVLDDHRLRVVAAQSAVEVISPIDIYSQIGKVHARPLVLAGNGAALGEIERHLLRRNPSLRMDGLSCFRVVEMVEQGLAPKKVIEDSGLKHVFNFANAAADCIVLACTHFARLVLHLRSFTDLPVYEIGEEMFALVKQCPHEIRPSGGTRRGHQTVPLLAAGAHACTGPRVSPS